MPDVSTSAVPDTRAVEDIEPDIGSPLFLTIPARTVSSVCADFDNGLWFWDMYEERLRKLPVKDLAGSPFAASQDNAYSLVIDMGNEVTFFCPNHQNKLPTELLVPDVLLPGQSD